MMKDKVNEIYTRLQTLDITPTLNNMEKLLQTLYDLRDIYNEIEQKEKDNGRETVDS